MTFYTGAAAPFVDALNKPGHNGDADSAAELARKIYAESYSFGTAGFRRV